MKKKKKKSICLYVYIKNMHIERCGWRSRDLPTGIGTRSEVSASSEKELFYLCLLLLSLFFLFCLLSFL